LPIFLGKKLPINSFYEIGVSVSSRFHGFNALFRNIFEDFIVGVKSHASRHGLGQGRDLKKTAGFNRPKTGYGLNVPGLSRLLFFLYGLRLCVGRKFLLLVPIGHRFFKFPYALAEACAYLREFSRTKDYEHYYQYQ